VKSNVTFRPAGGSNHPYTKCDFNGDPVRKAYLIGLRLGDLHVEQGKRAVRIRCTSTRPEQIELVRKLFAEYGGIWISKPIEVRGTGITAHLNLSFSFLVRHEDEIEQWILADDRSFAAFWAGYIDAEGSFIVCNKRALLKVDSCDVNILHQTWAKLHDMGVELPPPRLVRPSGTKVGKLHSKRDLWRLATESRSVLLRLCELISPYLQHDKRRADMAHVLAVLKQRHVPKIGLEVKDG
jgi:hypothetical protein